MSHGARRNGERLERIEHWISWRRFAAVDAGRETVFGGPAPTSFLPFSGRRSKRVTRAMFVGIHRMVGLDSPSRA